MVDIKQHKHQFQGSPRERTPVIDRIVFHEPAMSSLQPTLDTLSSKGLSVHYCIDRDGSITQHAPESRACAHAGGNPPGTKHNIRSIGIEVINRYYGHRVDQTKGLPLYQGAYAPVIISGIWVDRAYNATTKTFANPERKYIMMTAPQLEAAWLLTEDILKRHPVIKAGGWTGVTGSVYNWQTVSHHDGPGVKAHAQWAHADGRVADYYCLLRSIGFHPERAYQQTLRDAGAMQRQTPLPKL
jgi:N-acetyl-anhydromuramyl-L-alanine amidase AmpD